MDQWAFLEDNREKWGNCWAIFGDWNAITNNEEKRGGVRKHESDFVGFKEFILKMEMQELDQSRSFFTWGNNRHEEGYVEERLDRVFVSLDWMLRFPKMVVSNFYRSASSHNVILFDTEVEMEKRKKRFTFDSRWATMDGVQEAVVVGWDISVEGSQMFLVHEKVKNTRMALIAWAKPLRRNNEKTIQMRTAKLEEMRKQEE
ncbi:60 kDa chaperonin [Striga asiatica]|uniref:60 kDa chaperonin n=1 Tax=Striga asiatica TaxID=4170 RepID=A0A5A7Q5Y2_STRAF|nr:60 kDa chaperonin [Striga asiatica]